MNNPTWIQAESGELYNLQHIQKIYIAPLATHWAVKAELAHRNPPSAAGLPSSAFPVVTLATFYDEEQAQEIVAAIKARLGSVIEITPTGSRLRSGALA